MAKETSWGKVASWYDNHLEEGADTYHSQVILPNLIRLLDISTASKPKEKILDLACGQGFFSRAMAYAGAEVLGVDISPELIAIAQAKNEGKNNPRYEVHRAERIEGLASGAYDAVTIILALQNIQEYEKVLEECSRVLKPQGKLMLVLNHPCFRIPKQSAWGWDEAKKMQYRRVDKYLSQSVVDIDMHPGAMEKDLTVSFHRPLQAYSKALAKSGLVITKMEEWISHRKSEKGPRQKGEDIARKEIPLFLSIEAQPLLKR